MMQVNLEDLLIYLMDKYLALLAGIIFLIPGLIIAIAIKISSKGAVLYWSNRVGKDGILFSMPKFRTMVQDTPTIATDLLENPRQFITPVGSFLRRTSLDELPQLWCILRGQMAIVGPRPALFNQHKLIALRETLGVNSLIPGLTGWAQIHGRDELSEEDKAYLDAHYLRIRSLGINIFIIWKTFLMVIRGESISH